MIGVKLGAKGRWVWGQYALLIPEKAFKAIRQKGRQEPLMTIQEAAHKILEEMGKPLSSRDIAKIAFE